MLVTFSFRVFCSAFVLVAAAASFAACSAPQPMRSPTSSEKDKPTPTPTPTPITDPAGPTPGGSTPGVVDDGKCKSDDGNICENFSADLRALCKQKSSGEGKACDSNRWNKKFHDWLVTLAQK